MVDDEEALLALGQTALRDHGFETDTARDGLEGLRALQSGDYELLITDHHMPGLTGFDLIQRLRDAKISIPVVMASATPPTTEFSAHPRLCPQAFLAKPYTARQLVDEVERALKAG